MSHFNERLPVSVKSAFRGDVIEAFKIMHYMHDSEVSPNLRYYPKSNTREEIQITEPYEINTDYLTIRSAVIYERIVLPSAGMHMP